MIICSGCGAEVESIGQGKRCRPCYNEYMRTYMLERYHRRRAAFIESQGGACAVCGVLDVDFEIDHRDQYTKSFDLGKAIVSWSEARVQAEFKKCQLLCVPCHRAKTRKDLALRFGQREHWEHGTLGGYRYCKCVDCRRAKNEYEKRRRAAKKLSSSDPVSSVGRASDF